jgi:hypothetical protein
MCVCVCVCMYVCVSLLHVRHLDVWMDDLDRNIVHFATLTQLPAVDLRNTARAHRDLLEGEAVPPLGAKGRPQRCLCGRGHESVETLNEDTHKHTYLCVCKGVWGCVCVEAAEALAKVLGEKVAACGSPLEELDKGWATDLNCADDV